MEGGRSLHEQLGLPLTQKRDSQLMHTKVLFAMRYLLTFPDSTKGWIPFAMQGLEEIRKSTSVDAIVTTSPPVSAHLVGRKAKEMFGCPWIADLRDLWSQNLAQGNDLFRMLERPVERRTLRDADALVSVSEPWADRLRECYPDKSVFSITNGFDADDFRPRVEPLASKFTITYTGRLYEGKRDPTPLFEAIQELIRDGVMDREDIRVRFYGSIEPWLPALVNTFGLEDVIEVAGTVSREEALRLQRESQACSCFVGRILGRRASTPERCSSTWAQDDRFWPPGAVAEWSQICLIEPRPECMLRFERRTEKYVARLVCRVSPNRSGAVSRRRRETRSLHPRAHGITVC